MQLRHQHVMLRLFPSAEYETGCCCHELILFIKQIHIFTIRMLKNKPFLDSKNSRLMVFFSRITSLNDWRYLCVATTAQPKLCSFTCPLSHSFPRITPCVPSGGW